MDMLKFTIFAYVCPTNFMTYVSITSGMKPIELHACFSDLMNRDAWGGVLIEPRR